MASTNNRKTWQGYYPRRTKTRRETEVAAESKYRPDYESEEWNDDGCEAEKE